MIQEYVHDYDQVEAAHRVDIAVKNLIETYRKWILIDVPQWEKNRTVLPFKFKFFTYGYSVEGMITVLDREVVIEATCEPKPQKEFQDKIMNVVNTHFKTALY